MRLRTLPIVLTTLPLLVAGCDQVGNNLFVLPNDIRVNFRFEFQGNEVAGTAATVPAEATQEILDEIRAQGFGPETVARVTLIPGEAQVRIASAPGGVNIGFLDDISLRVSNAGGSSEVASAEDVATPGGMSNETDLDVSGENIAAIVVAGSFSGAMDVSGDVGLTPDGLYVLEAFFDVEVAVEGF